MKKQLNADRKLLQIGIIISLQLFISIINSYGQETKYYIDHKTTDELHDFLSYSKKNNLFFNAHRGGAMENFPENCLATFKNTLKYCRAVIEIDPRYTKDSVIILHHDAALERTTTGYGKVSDFTYRELKKLKLKDSEGKITSYRIPTLKKALNWAKGKTIFWLDKKDVPIVDRIRFVEECKAEANVVVLAYTFDEAKQGYDMNKNIMMQVFFTNDKQVEEFEKVGVPWSNVVAKLSPNWSGDPSLIDILHEKGVMVIAGSVRNHDQEYLSGKVSHLNELKVKYDNLFKTGIDVLETDIPVPLSKIYPEFFEN